jgi:hypothetical protein
VGSSSTYTETDTGSYARTAIGVAAVRGTPNLPVVISAEVEITPPKPRSTFE